MRYRRLIYLSLLFLSCTIQLLAQEKEEKKESGEEFKPHSTIGLVISHAHVFAGRDENGKKKVLGLASWGIDYNYHLSPKWAVGLHTDIIIESFKVEEHGGETIERSYPIAPALMGIYKPNHHWSLMAGVGEEFAKEENFFLTRLGVEYGAEIRNGWEVFGSLAYDIKWSAYDTWVLGLGISKAFGGHHKK
ncbi:MAG TPA: hypothetical protein VK166_17915 [Chitinophagaceae bacterium]|nr:hypothetical protein [Chitinophagaceae bacterium]